MYALYSLTDPTQAQANRRGEITPAQRTMLAAETNYGCASLFIVCLILPAIFVGIMAVVWYMDSRRTLPLWAYGLILGVLAFILVIAIVPQLWRAFNAWRVRNELTAGQVESMEGQVSWRRNKYVVETPARRLNVPTLAGGLMPGSYRFGFLPNTGWILSAERITPPGGEDPRAELAGVLAQVHSYSLDSLDSNRQGRMATGQIMRLLLAVVWQCIVGVIILAIIAVLAYIMYTTLNSQQREYAILAGLAVGAITILIVAWRVITLTIDALRGSVTTVEGPVRRDIVVTHTQNGGTSTTYYYKLNKLSFTVSSAAYTAFIDGLNYRIYYAPLSKRLIAIEPL
jgi:hypothetical protein